MTQIIHTIMVHLLQNIRVSWLYLCICSARDSADELFKQRPDSVVRELNTVTCFSSLADFSAQNQMHLLAEVQLSKHDRNKRQIIISSN